ncbi:hypothetical protein [Streptomyces sp. S465]|uniref:hypothetical protein n=1 Tax=Streptomyces sp. S465 TaxID=2979468 RepID=UPI0022A8AADA|nr:hypothetical protein [Streptomyces sp. S465]WAP54860.1 hypothetical protein N6H00_07570 [Streptomyces sp. S465]
MTPMFLNDPADAVHEIGGGSGHKPAFASPPAHTALETIRAADHGSGVLCLLGNCSEPESPGGGSARKVAKISDVESRYANGGSGSR